ncbi:MAG: hypothetical protein EGP82_06825 [Odoribacter splanchnicus]|nr:hypothetical protein [Odoribacter splanchnicus]
MRQHTKVNGQETEIPHSYKQKNDNPMKQIMILLLCIPLLLEEVSCNRPNKQDKTGGSQFNEKGLVALGQLWGFLKYHHPAVAEGKYNWDMELMKRVPAVLEAKEEKEWKNILNEWIDSLPPVPRNPDKKVPDGEAKSKPDYGELFNPEYFNPQTTAKIKYILENAVISSNHYIDVKNGIIDFGNEQAYENISYPDLPYRLLALFRHWNIVNYFFPYRDLCDQKWSEVLTQMLPEFINAGNQEEYTSACLKLVTQINDSHGFFITNNKVAVLNQGRLNPPFTARFIENKLVVFKYIGKNTYTKENVEIGDVITAINGEPVDSIVKKRLPYTPASNHVVKLRNMASTMLGSDSNTINITILRNNTPLDLKIPCYNLQELDSIYKSEENKKEGYRIIDNHIGYVWAARCTAQNRDRGITRVLDGTRGLIIDLRCYPGDYISLPFLKHLDHRSFPFSLVTFANVSYPGYFFTINSRKNVPQKIEKKENAYDKKIVVLVNQRTQSQAEDVALGFQLATNVTVIGSTTAGADGAVTKFSLPGGIVTYMSGRGVYYPDGTDLQRKGVKIDEYIEPTIAGIKAGRDEVLERAIEIIEESYKTGNKPKE